MADVNHAPDHLHPYAALAPFLINLDYLRYALFAPSAMMKPVITCDYADRHNNPNQVSVVTSSQSAPSLYPISQFSA